MDPYSTTEAWTGIPGAIAPADGNYTPKVLTPIPAAASGAYDASANQPRQQDAGATNSPIDLHTCHR
jgi:hypothetical protein